MSKLNLYHDQILDEYYNKGYSLNALVRKYGVHGKYIKEYLTSYGLPIKKHGRIAPHVQDKLNDREWLLKSYNESRSSQKIADVLGVTKQCVLKYMKKAGINPKGNQFYFSGDSGGIKELYQPNYTVESNYKSNKRSHKPRSKILQDKEVLLELYRKYPNISTLSNKLGISYPTVNNALHYHNIPIFTHGNVSNEEFLIASKLPELNVLTSFKLDDIELDLYIPEQNVAVEVNGIRFHSEIYGGKGRNYHQNKFEICQKYGIHLYQFWDIEVERKLDLIVSMIKSKCGIYNKIHGRSCVIDNDLCSGVVREFLDDNHLQGRTTFQKSLGLRYDGELVSVMTFNKPINGDYDWELNRYCVKRDLNIRGAFSKLLKYSPVGSLVSYSDCRYSSGCVYKKNGFIKHRTNQPIFYYTKNYRSLLNRFGFEKSKLKDKFPDKVDMNLTAWQNMQNLGYDRVWACKTYTWVKTT